VTLSYLYCVESSWAEGTLSKAREYSKIELQNLRTVVYVLPTMGFLELSFLISGLPSTNSIIAQYSPIWSYH
jgi:hypothetical protein